MKRDDSFDLKIDKSNKFIDLVIEESKIDKKSNEFVNLQIEKTRTDRKSNEFFYSKIEMSKIDKIEWLFRFKNLYINDRLNLSDWKVEDW